MKYVEPNLDKRIEDVKKLSERLLTGQVEDDQEFEWSLRLIVCKQYNIPIFSEYFSNLTLDQLLLEVELVRASRMTQEEKTSELVNTHKEELHDELFKDIEDPFTPPPMDPSQNQFAKDAVDFMQSGDFKQDPNE